MHLLIRAKWTRLTRIAPIDVTEGTRHPQFRLRHQLTHTPNPRFRSANDILC